MTLVIKLSDDGKEYEIKNDCLFSKSEAIKLILEKTKTIQNPDTINGLMGAIDILWELNENDIRDKLTNAIIEADKNIESGCLRNIIFSEQDYFKGIYRGLAEAYKIFYGKESEYEEKDNGISEI